MRRNGFTLVELSIVLVIIGLLLGGVIKGKAMIDNAKIKRVKSDIDGIATAVNTYQDKYRQLPGDDSVDHNGAGCTGNANGFINTTAERVCAWKQLIAAGMISGDKTQTTLAGLAKKTPYAGYYAFNSNANNPYYIYIPGNVTPNDTIESLDIKYDDGVYNTGDIISNRAYTDKRASQLTWYVY